MGLLEILTLAAVMVVLAAMPSTSVALVVTRAATLGFAQGAAVTAGIVTGDLMFVLLAVCGMAALAEFMGSLFVIIKWLAGIYLVWLGITLLRSPNGAASTAKPLNGTGLLSGFFVGLLVTLGDIKAIFFYASLFPATVNLKTLHVGDLALIALITIATVGGVKLAYAYCATRVMAVAASRVQSPAKTLAGCFMVGAGAWLIGKG